MVTEQVLKPSKSNKLHASRPLNSFIHVKYEHFIIETVAS